MCSKSVYLDSLAFHSRSKKVSMVCDMTLTTRLIWLRFANQYIYWTYLSKMQ